MTAIVTSLRVALAVLALSLLGAASVRADACFGGGGGPPDRPPPRDGGAVGQLGPTKTRQRYAGGTLAFVAAVGGVWVGARRKDGRG